jgi:hypothetical protein
MRPHEFQLSSSKRPQKRMAAIESAVNVVAGYLINVVRRIFAGRNG